MEQQKFAAAGCLLRDLYAKSGECQGYRVSPKAEQPWLIGVFNRASDDTRSHFSGLELVVVREIPAVTGEGTEKFVQLARFDQLDSASSAFPIGYAEGDLISDEEGNLRPSWFEVTKLRGRAMSDVIRLAPPQDRDRFFPITRSESARRAWQLVGKLAEHSATLEPIPSTPDLDLFR